jgi:hypothetical protein
MIAESTQAAAHAFRPIIWPEPIAFFSNAFNNNFFGIIGFVIGMGHKSTKILSR